MILSGTVVSDINNKTIVVKVLRRVLHPLYLKAIILSKKYHVHDPENKYKNGDIVSIELCAPISKKKKWQVIDR